MRYLSILIVLATTAGALHAQDKPTPPARESVSVDGVLLVVSSTEDNPNERLKEFLSEGQKFESWTKLASVREYPKLNDPRAVAENVVRALKQQNPGAQSAIIQNPKTSEVIVDFVTWPADNAFVEFNIFKYTRKEGDGLVGQPYALREYKDTATFLESLKSGRTRLINLMASGGLIGAK